MFSFFGEQQMKYVRLEHRVEKKKRYLYEKYRLMRNILRQTELISEAYFPAFGRL